MKGDYPIYVLPDKPLNPRYGQRTRGSISIRVANIAGLILQRTEGRYASPKMQPEKLDERTSKSKLE